ncbi:MAG: sigma-54-dependent transcriptional regulator [Candidatus Methylomirabilales bacterium]
MSEPTKVTIVVADDEESVRWTLKKALERSGYTVLTVGDGQSAVETAERVGADLILMDIKMPALDGLQALSLLRERHPEAMVIVMTAFGGLQAAVEAMKRGAYDYITKPFDFEELTLLVRRALEVKNLTHELNRLKAQLKDRQELDEIVGTSQGMQVVFKMVGQVADSNATVLIEGESGTGKELVAKAIHKNSPRQGGPFITVNCAAIPKDLLESELFGHEKGAFTGAVATRRGKFELADGGTIFLDEIGEMDPALQTKILRVFEERRFERLGGEVPITTDVRLVAATNRDLRALVTRGIFREDLFYRLNVVTITLPPLRERREDIPLLVTHFLRLYAGVDHKEVSAEALKCLLHYDWPGNVRELENVIKRACLLARTRLILPEHFPDAIQSAGRLPGIEAPVGAGTPGGFAREVRSELKRVGDERKGELYEYIVSLVERPLLQAVLERAGWNQLKAAQMLGINRNTLRKRMRQLGISGKRESAGDRDSS